MKSGMEEEEVITMDNAAMGGQNKREKDEKIEMGKREDEGEIGVGMEEIIGYEKRWEKKNEK